MLCLISQIYYLVAVNIITEWLVFKKQTCTFVVLEESLNVIESVDRRQKDTSCMRNSSCGRDLNGYVRASVDGYYKR